MNENTVTIHLTTRFKKSTIKIAGAAVLAPLAVILQALPPLFAVPWGMRIDFVAVPWVLCWFFFGFEAALLSLLISVPLVGVIGPFAGLLPGAVMKGVASVWMFAVPAFFAWRGGESQRLLRNKKLYVLASLLAILVRDIVTIVFNLYFAIPVFFGMSPQQVIDWFSLNPGPLSFVGHSLGLIGLGAFVAEVAFWNTVQGIFDMYVALLIGLIVVRRFPTAVKA